MKTNRNQIGAALIVLLFAQVALAFAISHEAAESARDKAEAKAALLAARVEQKATMLAIDTCRNTNPSRAFLQLRSRELSAGKLESTFTTRVTAKVFAIVDCVDTIKQGRPVLLPPKVEEQYLTLFKNERIGLTRGRKIVGSISFDDYFTEAMARRDLPLPPAAGTQPTPLPPAGSDPASP